MDSQVPSIWDRLKRESSFNHLVGGPTRRHAIKDRDNYKCSLPQNINVVIDIFVASKTFLNYSEKPVLKPL